MQVIRVYLIRDQVFLHPVKHVSIASRFSRFPAQVPRAKSYFHILYLRRILLRLLAYQALLLALQVLSLFRGLSYGRCHTSF